SAFATGASTMWDRLLRRRWCRGAVVVVLCAATSLLAATAHTISQKGRAFSPDQITLRRGDSVLFTNEDEFLHQIYVNTAGMTFDSSEQAPGQTIEVNFPRSGEFAVRCHIHPKMLLTVHVE